MEKNISEKFPAKERLKNRKDIEKVFKHGTRKKNQFLTLIRLNSQLQANATDGVKICIIVNRHIKTAVVRNKLKRRIRSIYRQNKTFFNGENIVIPHPGTEKLSFAELKEKLISLCKLFE